MNVVPTLREAVCGLLRIMLCVVAAACSSSDEGNGDSFAETFFCEAASASELVGSWELSGRGSMKACDDLRKNGELTLMLPLIDVRGADAEANGDPFADILLSADLAEHAFALRGSANSCDVFFTLTEMLPEGLLTYSFDGQMQGKASVAGTFNGRAPGNCRASGTFNLTVR